MRKNASKYACKVTLSVNKDGSRRFCGDYCPLNAQSITFLGHVVSVEGSHLDPKKFATMENFPIPKLVTNVRAFLGPIGYYGIFILGYAKIAKPFFGLTKKDSKFMWRPSCQGAFETLKKWLVVSLILTRLDFSKPLILDVDRPPIRGVGTILSKKIERQEQVIAYASKGLSPVQKRF